MRLDDIHGYPHVSRACLVAMTGGHTMLLLPTTEAGQRAAERFHEALTVGCFENVSLGIALTPRDITIDVGDPVVEYHPESDETMMANAKAARARPFPVWSFNDGAITSLVKTARSILGLDDDGEAAMMGVAFTIARLAGSSSLHVAHVAEAVQYTEKRGPQ
jgi:hypothetical protein